MSAKPFVHLHCHSHYSLLDGAAPIGKLVQRTIERGMNALALTDHGNLHGALEFYRKCKDKGINPIIGYEAYIAPGSRLIKSGGAGKESSYHLTLLAKNATGFRNLIKLASAASLEGFHYKPRIDKEILAAHQEGLICLSGCVSSEFSRAILRGGNGADDQIAEAIRIAQWFHGTFGDRYFIEIMNNDVDIQREQLKGAVEVANRVGLPLVATSDCHYCDRDEAAVQDVMLCINTGSFRTDTQRLKMENDQFFLRSPEEMYAKFPGLEDACLRSQEIADTVDIQLELGKRFFPIFKLPPEVDPDDRLRELCYLGLLERYADNPEMCAGGVLAQVVVDRIERELGVIKKLGFANYFLICWDFVDQARMRDIPATARGSGVGAIVCYALYLSHVCPIKYGLLFERFLDENRLEAPDIDIDFCKDRRGDIIRYVKDKYGEECVAQIGTFGTMKARAAIKDVGRALGIPLARVNQVTAMVPETLNITLAEAIEKSEDLRKVYEGDPEIGELLDFAKQLEGMARNVGTHAAAVVIADGPLTDYVPLGRVTGKTDVITQWPMKDVELAGLLKMDFLGLRTLTILRNTVDLIQQTTGKRIDVLKFPLDDKAAFRLLQSGETKGVFQLESGGIRDLLQKMKPDHFLDIVATNALYRPGPLEGGMVQQYIDVKHGRKAAEYKHPVLQSILEETNGVMVYQEQVMQILNQLGQIPLAAAYTCIKAISKKNEGLISKNYEQFMQGAVDQGLNKKDAQEMWDMILKFAGYGFNKCVVGSTEIVDAITGERTSVEELFKNRRKFNVHALCDDWKLRPRSVTDVVWNGVVQTYTVTTRTGRQITATANHPLRTLNGWTTIAELNVGDHVATARSERVEVTHHWNEHEVVIPESVNRIVARERQKNGIAWRVLEQNSGVCIRELCRKSPAKKRGFQRSTINRISECLDSQELQDIANSDVYWDSIVSIEAATVEDVYDLTVEHDHNFLGNGIVVHNSHSTAYALVAYQTAYLKAHYPVEFMAALLTGDIPGRNFTSKDSLVEHMEDCARMNVAVVNPCINHSDVEFTVEEDKVYFAMSAIKGCGAGAAEALATERKTNGPFKNLFDVCQRVEVTRCGRSSLESLIKAGAMDCCGARRSQLFAVLDKALQVGAAKHKDKLSGQKSLFDDGDDSHDDEETPATVGLPDVPELDERQKLAAEKEVLGFYLSSHPLAAFEDQLTRYCSHKTTTIERLKDRDRVSMGGMLSSIKVSHVKNPKDSNSPTKYVMFDLEDVEGSIRCILWPQDYAKYTQFIVPDAIVVLQGRLDFRGGDEANLIVDKVVPINQLSESMAQGIKIRFDERELGRDKLRVAQEVLRGYPGDRMLKIQLSLQDGAMLELDSKQRIEVNEELCRRLRDVLGETNVETLIDEKSLSAKADPAPKWRKN